MNFRSSKINVVLAQSLGGIFKNSDEYTDWYGLFRIEMLAGHDYRSKLAIHDREIRNSG